MTLAELLQNRFRADLRHRGAAYIEAERISLVRVTTENVFGLVMDGAEYQTQLRYQPDDIVLFCTCEQYAKSKVCKHLWATILATDSGGYVSSSMRPGRMTPFMAPNAYQPISVDDLDGVVAPVGGVGAENGEPAGLAGQDGAGAEELEAGTNGVATVGDVTVEGCGEQAWGDAKGGGGVGSVNEPVAEAVDGEAADLVGAGRGVANGVEKG